MHCFRFLAAPLLVMLFAVAFVGAAPTSHAAPLADKPNAGCPVVAELGAGYPDSYTAEASFTFWSTCKVKDATIVLAAETEAGAVLSSQTYTRVTIGPLRFHGRETPTYRIQYAWSEGQPTPVFLSGNVYVNGELVYRNASGPFAFPFIS